MKEAVEKAMKSLAEKAEKDTESVDALRNTQAALNLAHVLSLTDEISRRKK